MQTGKSPDKASASPRRRAPSRRWLRVWAPVVALSLSAHLAVFLALVSAPAPITIPEPEPEPRAIVVTLTRPPPPPPPPAPVVSEPPPGPVAAEPAATPSPAPPRPVPARAAPRPRPVRTPPPPTVPTLPANPTPVVASMTVLGEAQLAGALQAGTGQGSGSGGGGAGAGSGGACDMVRRLQDALRADPEVLAAVTRAHRAMPASGRAILVWDGDWIQDPGQAGKGLAGVRQAIALEVAFSPRECRTQTMRGLAVIAFADGPGAPRLALGEQSWSWTDLLGAR